MGLAVEQARLQKYGTSVVSLFYMCLCLCVLAQHVGLVALALPQVCGGSWLGRP